ncbi:hypothetical protein AKJ43_02340 [candidate division MSBL1 archaeon SCGC-AAA261D19]|uniref:Transcriptional regulator n=1 Tax=candidate division MSBL1 archaeon SCGC-AAA261D19 TaxID=1698273 RepID=A0A133V6V8_9EURY|nr:hypothetical protein AKJ43_02340 [candidate division MSBL1 archaeon SCGC-AAA261D19]
MRILRPSEIRILRNKLGLTQSKLAELSGITQAYVAKIESGSADPRISTLERISKALEEIASKESFTAEQIMTKPIISVKPDDKIKKAIELMVSSDISQMPILQNNQQLGSIAEDTLIRKISAGEDIFKLVEQTIGSIMDDPFPTVGGRTDVGSLFPILEHSPAVLVLDKGKPMGIITKADILQLSAAGR